jgi:hypothetical protein
MRGTGSAESNFIKEQVGNNKARHGTKSGKGWTISHPNSKLNLVTRFGSAGTELGLLYYRDVGYFIMNPLVEVREEKQLSKAQSIVYVCTFPIITQQFQSNSRAKHKLGYKSTNKTPL